MAETAIEWTERTWNPIAGCSVHSPGCTNCYAMRMAARLGAMAVRPDGSGNVALNHYVGLTQKTRAGHVWTGKIAVAPDSIFLAPLRRRKPTTWFVNSMSDLFHDDVPDAVIDRVFAVMALCPQHTFQVLTKRADRMRKWANDPATIDRVWSAIDDLCQHWYDGTGGMKGILLPVLRSGDGPGDPLLPCMAAHGAIWGGEHPWPLRNVWLGVSVEDQPRADRIDDLRQTPAAIRFVSFEPLLGGVETDLTGIDWAIVGGESGPGARPMHPDWALGLRDRCQAAGVAFFFKQWGDWKPLADDAGYWPATGKVCIRLTSAGGRDEHGWPFQRVGKKAAGRLLDGREWKETPHG